MRPPEITCTCSQRLITACITCSIIRMVTPPARISCNTGRKSRSSDGFNPANTSSSSNMRGRVASARATSRRFRPATVSAAAGLSNCGPRPRRWPTSSASAKASRRLGRRRKAPTAIFSRTESPAKGCTIWKVRARPSFARSCGLRPVISSPSNNTSPALGCSKPAIIAKSVVLPAPFGPINPVIEPSRTSKVASATAVSPPKRLVRSRTARKAGSLPCPVMAPPCRASARRTSLGCDATESAPPGSAAHRK